MLVVPHCEADTLLYHIHTQNAQVWRDAEEYCVTNKIFNLAEKGTKLILFSSWMNVVSTGLQSKTEIGTQALPLTGSFVNLAYGVGGTLSSHVQENYIINLTQIQIAFSVSLSSVGKKKNHQFCSRIPKKLQVFIPSLYLFKTEQILQAIQVFTV